MRVSTVLRWTSGPLLFLLMWLMGNTLDWPSEMSIVLGTALWMVIWWIAELIPMGATALIPVVIYPLAGIMGTADVVANFANKTIYLFLGGFMIALGLERSGLHVRIALQIIRLFGKSARGVLFGFLLATCLLSMWVSNTATALMMLPMARSILLLLEKELGMSKQDRTYSSFATALCLGIAYAANIGGVATLIGTPPNVVMKGYVEEMLGITLYFSDWLILGIPLSLTMLAILYFYFVHLRFKLPQTPWAGIREAMGARLKEIGGWSKKERVVGFFFTLTATLWILAPYINELIGSKWLDDTIIAIFGGLMMFVWPIDRSMRHYVLNWEDTRDLPWDILLLFGGGLCLASGMQSSGMVEAMNTLLAGYSMHPLVLLILLCAIMLLLTEVMSNVALANILIPLVISLTASRGLDSLEYAIAVGLASSFAFMLPVSTPPNAIVYGSGYISIKQMVRTGLFLNLIGVAIIVLFVKLLGPLVF